MSTRLDAIEEREAFRGEHRWVVLYADDRDDLAAVARAALDYLAAAQHGLNDSTDDNKLGEALRPLLAEAAS